MTEIQKQALLITRNYIKEDKESLDEAIENSGGIPYGLELTRLNNLTIDLYEKEIQRLKNIIIPLEEDSNWLNCLRNAGVDNWEGYEIAIDMFNEEYGESD